MIAFGLQDIVRYRHACVRDLAWALLSPPLLVMDDDDVHWFRPDWCRQAYQAYAWRLDELDRDPTSLQAFLLALPDKRLGSQFEGLLHFWLDDPANTLYRLLVHSLPIRHNKQTLGELDFLVQDRNSGDIQHWEVAIRFYLGTGTSDNHANWVGVDPSDRLDLKVSRMRRHQLPMSLTPEGHLALSELGISSCQRACLLKGRLFYPARAAENVHPPANACPEHWRGWWIPAPDLPSLYPDPDLRWARLPREYRLAPLTPDVHLAELASASQLLDSLDGNLDSRPIAVVGLRAGQEATRGFLVPPGWPPSP